MKRNIADILHNADQKTVEHIADKYTAADKKTAERIFNNCISRLDTETGQTEVFTAERVGRAPMFAPAFIAAASIIVILGAIGIIYKLKAPSPNSVDDTPVIVATGTTVVSTTDEYQIVETTQTKAVSIVTDSNETATKKPVTTVTTKKGSSHSTVKTGQGTRATTTTAKAPKTTAKTTKNNAQTTTTKAVEPPKPEKHMTLAEIEDWENQNLTCILSRERAVLNGAEGADSPRITLAQVKQFIAEGSNFNEINRKIQSVQRYPDVNGGSGVSLIEYWVGGNRNDIILVSPESRKITHITCTDENPLYGNTPQREELYTETEEAREKELIDTAYKEINPYYYYNTFDNSEGFEHHTPDGVLVDYKNAPNYMYYEAGTIPIDRVLGAVTDEQDAVEKARYVFLNACGQEFIDWLEKEPTHDPEVEYQRTNPPFKARYYEQYDIWYVYPTSPEWKPVDGTGKTIVSWSEGARFVFIRGRDGKLLGSFINY